ncbi:MAG: hypothetical protein KF729_19240 [Sandaracinaceae bacterium]|nr:hypothetical protein [Sandaracinaceae bacterium]
MSALEAILDTSGATPCLRAPCPGLFRDALADGALVRAGTTIGALEVLGRAVPLVAPSGAFGVATQPAGPRLARRPVGHGDALFTLDPEGVRGATDTTVATGEAAGASGPVFRAPLGGRYYGRPAPDEPPFVEAGAALAGGETVALIEVMKTFNRVRYDGEPGRVVRVVPVEGADVAQGDVLLVLE